MSQHASNPAFLSVIAWPEGSSFEQQVAFIAGETGFDHATLRLRMKQQPPFIIGAMSPEVAAATVLALRRAGGEAMSIRMSQIEALGESHKVRDVRITPAGILLDIWWSETVTISPDDIDVLITAGIASETIQRRSADLRGTVGGGLLTGAMLGNPGVGAALGLANAMKEVAAGAGGADRHIQHSYKVDVHLRPPHGQPVVYQVDCDKFAFSVLGDLKGHSDLANSRKLLELFQHLAPNAFVDEYFALFKPPTGHHRLRLPNMKRNRDDPAFAFYSRWSTLVYRYLAQSSS